MNISDMDNVWMIMWVAINVNSVISNVLSLHRNVDTHTRLTYLLIKTLNIIFNMRVGGPN